MLQNRLPPAGKPRKNNPVNAQAAPKLQYKSFTETQHKAPQGENNEIHIKISSRINDSLLTRKAAMGFYMERSIIPGIIRLAESIKRRLDRGLQRAPERFINDTDNYSRIMGDLELIKEQLYQVDSQIFDLTFPPKKK